MPMAEIELIFESGLPEIATTSGPQAYDYALSYLPGQRLSRCTCPNDSSHPGPVLPNGTFVGRAAPEIDMFEALVRVHAQSSRLGYLRRANP
jgi:hypothetical protein